MRKKSKYTVYSYLFFLTMLHEDSENIDIILISYLYFNHIFND